MRQVADLIESLSLVIANRARGRGIRAPQRSSRHSSARLSGLVVLTICSAASACATRPGPEVLMPAQPASDATKTVTVYAATTRAHDTVQSNAYNSERAKETNFASFDISLPKDHAAGAIEWPKGRPDARKSFAVTGQQTFDRDEFSKAIAARADVGTMVFVHGYNYNYQEALFRLAQMSADAHATRLPILFAWPSVASARGYLADREGAAYSRDNLAALMVDLSEGRRQGDVVIFAHSMGAWLTLEALRQLSLQDRNDVLAKLRVVLAAPDIDADVFETQARRVKGKLARPLTVLVSKDDRALRASSFLSANRPKVGTIDVEDKTVRALARRNNIVFVDISAIDATGTLGHDRYIDLTTMIPQLRLDNSAGGPLAQAGAFVFEGIKDGTHTPLQIAGPAARQKP